MWSPVTDQILQKRPKEWEDKPNQSSQIREFVEPGHADYDLAVFEYWYSDKVKFMTQTILYNKEIHEYCASGWSGSIEAQWVLELGGLNPRQRNLRKFYLGRSGRLMLVVD